MFVLLMFLLGVDRQCLVNYYVDCNCHKNQHIFCLFFHLPCNTFKASTSAEVEYPSKYFWETFEAFQGSLGLDLLSFVFLLFFFLFTFQHLSAFNSLLYFCAEAYKYDCMMVCFRNAKWMILKCKFTKQMRETLIKIRKTNNVMVYFSFIEFSDFSDTGKS